MTIHPKHMEWLMGRAIDPEVALSAGVISKNDGNANWLAFPYSDPETGEIVNCKYRLTGQKRFRMDEGGPLLLWNLKCLTDAWAFNPSEPVIICEGEMDALSAMTAGWQRVLSVPNGAPAKAEDGGPIDPENDKARYAPIWNARRLLDRVATFIIATDADEPGRILAAELVRRLGPERCRLLSYPDGCKDLNDVLLLHGEAGVSRAITSARAYPVQGLYKMSDFLEEPQPEPFRVRIPEMYDCWPVVPGRFTVVTGYPGKGKTTWMMACLADLMLQNVNICLGSFETTVNPIMRDTLRQHLCGTNLKGLTPEKKAFADRIIEERLTIIAQQSIDDDSDMDLDAVLELAKIAVLRDGARVVVLDPWNQIEHKRRGNESETEYVGRAIRQMKRFAKNYGVALVIVAHPAKPNFEEAKHPPSLYSIAGSAHWYNAADYGIVIHRKRESNITQVANVKVRMGNPGSEGVRELAWDWERARFERPAVAMMGEDA
jgi:twinkle protein